MKRLLTILLLATTTLAAEPTPKEKKVLKQITTFLSNPQKHKNLGVEIITFAGKSPDHFVVLDPKYMPWVKNKNLPDGHQLLLAAFIGGNLQAQIEKKSKKPEPQAGLAAAKSAYQKIKSTNTDFFIAALE